MRVQLPPSPAYFERMKMLSQKLNSAIVNHVESIISELGFGYVPDIMAPSTFPELRKAFSHSVGSLIPLPVYSGGSDTTIYGVPEVNFAFRFWHDIEHITGNHDFSLSGEIHTGYRQLAILEAKYGFGPSSLEWKLLYADVIGQVHYYHKHGTFVENQCEFVKEFIKCI